MSCNSLLSGFAAKIINDSCFSKEEKEKISEDSYDNERKIDEINIVIDSEKNLCIILPMEYEYEFCDGLNNIVSFEDFLEARERIKNFADKNNIEINEVVSFTNIWYNGCDNYGYV